MIHGRSVMLQYNLRLMNEYLLKFKGFLDEMSKNLSHEYLKSLSPDETLGNLSIELQFYEKFNRTNINFPKFHYSSFLVTCYSLIESELKEVCQQMHEMLKYSENFDDKRLKGIYQIKRHLNQVLDVDIEESHWKELVIIGRIRNKIVHIGLDFDKKLNHYNEVELKAYIDIHSLMVDGKYKLMTISFTYCLHVMKFIERLFENLHLKISKKYFH